MNKGVFVGVRMNEQQAEILSLLAKLEDRSKGAVIRQLIEKEITRKANVAVPKQSDAR